MPAACRGFDFHGAELSALSDQEINLHKHSFIDIQFIKQNVPIQIWIWLLGSGCRQQNERNDTYCMAGTKMIRFDESVKKDMFDKNFLKGTGGKKGKSLKIEVQTRKDKKQMRKAAKKADVKRANIIVEK